MLSPRLTSPRGTAAAGPPSPSPAKNRSWFLTRSSPSPEPLLQSSSSSQSPLSSSSSVVLLMAFWRGRAIPLSSWKTGCDSHLTASAILPTSSSVTCREIGWQKGDRTGWSQNGEPEPQCMLSIKALKSSGSFMDKTTHKTSVEETEGNQTTLSISDHWLFLS